MDDQPVIDRLHPSRSEHAYHPLRMLAQALTDECVDVGGPVVDLGCGAKPYARLFPAPYIGLDLQAFHGRPDVLATAEQLPMRTASVGTVVSTQQLEHVASPEHLLREARRILPAGGRLLLSTHGVWAHHPDPHDYWRWTEEGLILLINSSGFRVERSHPLGGFLLAGTLLATYPLVGYMGKASGKRLAAARRVVRLVNGVVWPLDQALQRHAPRPYASVGYLVSAIAV